MGNQTGRERHLSSKNAARKKGNWVQKPSPSRQHHIEEGHAHSPPGTKPAPRHEQVTSSG